MVRWLPSFRSKPPAPARGAEAGPAGRGRAPAPSTAAASGSKAMPRTHEGCVRTHNEDSYVARDDGGLWAVADGMGGHEGGEWASGRIVRELGRIDLALGFEETCEEAAQGVIRRQQADPRRGQEARQVDGLDRGHAGRSRARVMPMLWAGDSRAYLMRGGKLERLSRDHTQVQEMVTRGLMTAEQAQGHPMGHVLSRAVGVQKEVEIERAEGEVQPGDIFLLCSDGLHGVVGEEAIAAPFRPRGAGAGARPADRPDARKGRARQCHRHRDLDQRADPPLLCGNQAMSDEKDKDAQGAPPPPETPASERGAHGVHAGRLHPAAGGRGRSAAVPAPEPPPSRRRRRPSRRGGAAAEPVAEARRRSPQPARRRAEPAPPPEPAPTGDAASAVGIAPRKDAVGIKVGDVLNHIFRVDRFLARGGMGEVFVGCNVNVDEKVAIKVMLPALAGDEKVVAMFRKEARTLTKLNHPALVQYRVLAQEPALHVLYIVTDFIEGTNLSDALGHAEAVAGRAGRPAPPARLRPRRGAQPRRGPPRHVAGQCHPRK